ncbi:MAG: pilus assembly PilX family protein [Gammaproteobacteria bacterium]
MKRNARSEQWPSRHRNRGAVLAVALLFLVILTLLGFTVLGVSQQEQKMAGQYQRQYLIQEQTEACLKIAEADAANAVDTQLNTDTPNFVPGIGHINVDGGAAPAALSDPAFWTGARNSLACDESARYVVEYLGMRNIADAADRYTNRTRAMHSFRITARGHDANTDTQVMLQTIYLRNAI